MISQALVDAKIDVSASALGLANFKKLLSHGKKDDTEEEQGIFTFSEKSLKKKKPGV
jgi:hypothetical protein